MDSIYISDITMLIHIVGTNGKAITHAIITVLHMKPQLIYSKKKKFYASL